MGTIYKRGKTYWIKYYQNGKPLFESSKSHLKMVARELLKQREGDISQGKIPGIYFAVRNMVRAGIPEGDCYENFRP